MFSDKANIKAKYKRDGRYSYFCQLKRKASPC